MKKMTQSPPPPIQTFKVDGGITATLPLCSDSDNRQLHWSFGKNLIGWMCISRSVIWFLYNQPIHTWIEIRMVSAEQANFRSRDSHPNTAFFTFWTQKPSWEKPDVDNVFDLCIWLHLLLDVKLPTLLPSLLYTFFSCKFSIYTLLFLEGAMHTLGTWCDYKKIM